MEILNIFIEVIAPYILEILVVGAIVEIIKKQWLVKFLYKNVRWWIIRILPIFTGCIICLIWRLGNFNYIEYLKAVGVCWAFSSAVYGWLEKILKKGNNENEENNY